MNQTLESWDLVKVLFLGTPSYGGRFSDARQRMRSALEAAERQKCDATEIDPSTTQSTSSNIVTMLQNTQLFPNFWEDQELKMFDKYEF